MKLPEIGAPAPSFRLATAAGTEVSLEDFRGVKSVVLWFSKGLF
jgi:peroxiredoxin